ncbi:MAG: pyridoxal 5'-phosphate synthase glutaminase subunit PdxT [Actinomycetota bacterium]|nr:pyridoxal 5'-phosphate synthase glutaminase subunit PdxT [Actinomycetota bacterium]
MVKPLIGVLSLQGDFAEHKAVLDSCGYRGIEVRSPEELELADALIIPGGESTTQLKLIDRYDLRDPLRKRAEGGMPLFGTCAGAIVLATRTSDGEPPLEVLPISIVRNAYGRQADSFEADIDVPELRKPVRGVFIRAPIIEDPAGGSVMATFNERPVLVRFDRMLVSTFHPELVGERAIHEYFVQELCGGA